MTVRLRTNINALSFFYFLGTTFLWCFRVTPVNHSFLEQCFWIGTSAASTISLLWNFLYCLLFLPQKIVFITALVIRQDCFHSMKRLYFGKMLLLVAYLLSNMFIQPFWLRKWKHLVLIHLLIAFIVIIFYLIAIHSLFSSFPYSLQ